jgi:hypothetical protein
LRDPPRSLMRTGLAALAALATLVACDASDGPLVRDDNGVRIVEHAAMPADLERWSVADTPSLSIGAVDGAGPAVFGRVAAALERADGAIVVADAHAFEIRAFDAVDRDGTPPRHGRPRGVLAGWWASRSIRSTCRASKCGLSCDADEARPGRLDAAPAATVAWVRASGRTPSAGRAEPT